MYTRRGDAVRSAVISIRNNNKFSLFVGNTNVRLMLCVLGMSIKNILQCSVMVRVQIDIGKEYKDNIVIGVFVLWVI